MRRMEDAKRDRMLLVSGVVALAAGLLIALSGCGGGTRASGTAATGAPGAVPPFPQTGSSATSGNVRLSYTLPVPQTSSVASRPPQVGPASPSRTGIGSG